MHSQHKLQKSSVKAVSVRERSPTHCKLNGLTPHGMARQSPGQRAGGRGPFTLGLPPLVHGLLHHLHSEGMHEGSRATGKGRQPVHDLPGANLACARCLQGEAFPGLATLTGRNLLHLQA